MSDSLKYKWWEFHKNNPHVYDLVEQFTFDVINRGYNNYSINSVFERIRWHTDIETKAGVLIAESKYQSAGRGFSFLTKTHKEQPADIYLLKQKSGQNFICIEITNPIATKIIGWLTRR